MIQAMKQPKKSSNYEPTIKDVMGSVQDLTEAVQAGFERLETGSDRHEQILKTLHEGQENFRGQLKDFGTSLTNTQNRVEDVADMVESLTQVSDKDHMSIVDHEHRILHLEKSPA